LKFVNTQLAPKARLEVKVVTFNDCTEPNTTLRNKIIDANFFQYQLFMNHVVNELEINLLPLNLVLLSTLGLFWESLKSVKESKEFEVLIMETSLFLPPRLLL